MESVKTGNKVKKKKKDYSIEKIKEALAAIHDGMSLRAASKKFGVPRSTLLDKHKGKTSLQCKLGPITVLKEEQEQELVEWILRFNKLGFHITKNQIFDSVQILLNNSQTKSKFTNNRPGRYWYDSFLKRHPELLKNISAHSSTSQDMENDLRDWHTQLKDYLVSKKLDKNKPQQIFVVEETSFVLDLQEDENNGKECVVTLFVGNAAGEILPPMIIFSSESLPQSIKRNLPVEWNIYHCDKANVSGEAFYKYITDTFYPWLLKNNVTLPVILYINGHKSYLSLPLCNFCNIYHIEIVAVSTKVSNVIQPLDIGLFQQFRVCWYEMLQKWQETNNGIHLNKENCISFLENIINSLDIVNSLKQAFEKCGLYPLCYDPTNYQMITKCSTVEKKITAKHTKTLNGYKSQFLPHFTFFEQNIDSDILTAFKEAEITGQWIGDIRHETLFKVWIKMKRLIYNQQGLGVEIFDQSGIEFLEPKENVSDDEIKLFHEVTPQIIEGSKNIITRGVCTSGTCESLWT